MSNYPYTLAPGDTFHLALPGGARSPSRTATAPITIHDEAEAIEFVMGYNFPKTTVPGERLQLLGMEVVIAEARTFQTYHDMEWWCANAEGIPGIGLFDAVRSENS